MRTRHRVSLYLALIFCSSLAIVSVTSGHDCSGPSDCAVIPPNVDIATGIGAVGAGAAIGWSIVRRRNGKGQPPCQELRHEVAAGEARIKELEGKIAAAQADLERAGKAAGDRPLPPKKPDYIS